ncbi:glycosyltransferase involved in cell wall biosynthesis [Bacillus mesophilus]|uniref:Glycosyltransferase family 4 protein n=1 Tax=Bacillus mesophilus TaxID=1808955 RepID=A0A6M0QAQ5_9BACI|nr:glycosyltransferase family 4 protein [Bacillus mesophilus]MBM7662854.1 glycosyltransferase involved in cell wall biosynthesis [Bacillus mesophilus]NEY73444.1 glycosyltransferase family 4 protein [Bacillus mesophilus]
MKVCILTSVHSIDDTRIFYKEALSLKNMGHDVYFIVQHDQDTVINGVKIVSISTPASRRDRLFKTIFEVYRKALKVNADIYHFHDPELIIVGLLLKAKGKKVIYDVHEDVPRQILSKHWINRSLRTLISIGAEWVENTSVRCFDAVITATPHISKRFEKMAKNVVTVCNYPMHEEFREDEEILGEKGVAVCYIGGLSRTRGIEEMIQSIEKADSCLLLAGSFEEKELRNKMKQLPGWPKVVELGYLDREGIRAILRQSVAGLYLGHPTPAYIHSLPIKIFEYMASGIPVISSNFPLLVEIVEGGKCGVCVDPFDTNAVSSAIQWLVDHPEEAKEMGKNGREAVQTRYNWEAESTKLKRVYEQL